MSPISEPDSPWPGPRPYEETEWEIFFGRTRDVDLVLRRFSVQRLTILSGPSGTGKTSLLRAGIVPRLRLKRYRDQAEKAWPVLVMREWGAGFSRGKPGLLLGSLIRKSLEGITLWHDVGVKVASDLELFSTALDEAEAAGEHEPVALLERLASLDGVGGLYLILDQFEEVLRLGRSSAKEMIRLLKEIYESGLPIKMLVSLRQEHLADLRELERTVGGLMGQTVFLAPMENVTAKQAVEAAADAFKIKFIGDVVGSIIENIGLDGEESYNLLSLQAVLYDFFTECVRGISHARGLEVTAEDLDGYIGQYDLHSRHGRGLASVALERWIQRALINPSSFKGARGLKKDQMNAMVRRIAIRLGPHLSSGGFKVSQEDSDLLRKAVGDDLRTLSQGGPEQRRAVRILSPDPPLLNTGELGLSVENGERERERLSGFALSSGWSPARTANETLRAYIETLLRLKEGNIVKPVLEGSMGIGEGERWELVHDGLGQPFMEWASDRLDDWDDCSGSVVACRGITPIVLKAEDCLKANGLKIHHLRWEGCLVIPGESGLVLEGVTFEACALRGTVFESMSLRNCLFVRCDLSGTIFKNCKFDGVSFEESRPDSLAIIKSEIGEMSFQSCSLSQLTVRSVEVVGCVKFLDSEVSLSNFVDIRGRGEKSSAVFDEGCAVSYCSGDDMSWSLMDFRCRVERSKEIIVRSKVG
jgi:hypothetical protein